MKRIIFILTLFIFLLVPMVVFSTGPSNMSSVIKPVSVSPEGVILCKTKFTKNSMGALRIMPVQYGWALIFPDGKMEEYPFHYFDSDSYPDEALVQVHDAYLERIFQQEIDWNNPPVSLLPLIARYKFNLNNIKPYLVDKKMALNVFLNTYGLNSKSVVQRTLKGYCSTQYGDTVHVLYVIKKIVFIKNYIQEDNYDNPIGAKFDFYIPYGDELLNFDVFDITGIVSLK